MLILWNPDCDVLWRVKKAYDNIIIRNSSLISNQSKPNSFDPNTFLCSSISKHCLLDMESGQKRWSKYYRSVPFKRRVSNKHLFQLSAGGKGITKTITAGSQSKRGGGGGVIRN